MPLTDLETESDVEMIELGNRLLVTRGYGTAPRIVAVTLNAATDPSVVDLLATVDPRLPSRFRCRHVSDDGRLVFNRFMFCTAIRHTIGPDIWEARLSSTTPSRGRSAPAPDSGRQPKARCRALAGVTVARRLHTMRSNN